MIATSAPAESFAVGPETIIFQAGVGYQFWLESLNNKGNSGPGPVQTWTGADTPQECKKGFARGREGDSLAAMKTFLSWRILTVVLCGLVPAVHADLLPVKNSVLTGMITTEPLVANKPLVNTPITKANLLSLFDTNGGEASEISLFFETSNSSFVLASKDKATIYVTLIEPLTDDPQFAFLAGKSSGQQKSFSQITVFNNTFKGVYTTMSKATASGTSIQAKLTVKFSASGKIGNAMDPNAIATGTITGTVTFPNSP